MLVGTSDEGGATQPANDAAIFDVTAADFEDRVMKASMEMPVLVDFWAPWCGPCKQLGPVLEKAVQAAGGKIAMARVNLDENPELAQALQVQSVPTVFAFFQGQPVTAFTGVKPESEINAFISQLVKMAGQAKPDAIDIPEALKMAGQALADGDLGQAQGIYAQILSQDEMNVQAYIGLVRTFIAAGDLEQARYMIDDVPEAVAKDPQFDAARTALELAEDVPGGGTDIAALAGAVDKNPDDHQARFDLAMAQFAAGQKEEAVDSLLEIIARKRDWEEDKARHQLLKFFEAMGHADPVTIEGRRKLSSILFS